MNEYLPPATLSFCRTKLLEVDIDLNQLTAASQEVSANGQQTGNMLHARAYHTLRGFVRAHLTSGLQPELLETTKPEGGYKNIKSYEGLLHNVIEENAKYASIGNAINAQLAYERDHPELFEEDVLPDDYEIILED